MISYTWINLDIISGSGSDSGSGSGSGSDSGYGYGSEYIISTFLTENQPQLPCFES